MMALRVGCVVGLISLACGCSLLSKYYTLPKHFPLGTAKVKRVSQGLEKTYDAALTVLEQNGWGVSKKERSEESAIIAAYKEERELIFDLRSEGESAEVRLEINQAGNDADVWAMLNELDMLL